MCQETKYMASWHDFNIQKSGVDMKISEVSLQGFRNLEKLYMEPSEGIHVFYGQNAQGKTNFLESLYFCAMGRSMRTKNEQQLIGFDEEESHIRLRVNREKRYDKIDIHLKRDMKKGIAVNGIPIRRLGDLFGTLYVVIFSPEDLSLIKDGPGERRRFLDMELCQISRVYFFDLQQYYHVLKNRNQLLKQLQKNPSLRETLFVWDVQLAEFGKRVILARESFLKRLDEISSDKLNALTGGKDKLRTVYKPNCDADSLLYRLEKGLERDIFMGYTQSGPHKDDIMFMIDDKEAKFFGSQGQQRTTALALRLAEIDLIQEETGEKPILLLDDVLSELDKERQVFLMQSIQGLQTFLTCTGVEDTVKSYVSKENLFFVENGKIER